MSTDFAHECRFYGDVGRERWAHSSVWEWLAYGGCVSCPCHTHTCTLTRLAGCQILRRLFFVHMCLSGDERHIVLFCVSWQLIIGACRAVSRGSALLWPGAERHTVPPSLADMHKHTSTQLHACPHTRMHIYVHDSPLISNRKTLTPNIPSPLLNH